MRRSLTTLLCALAVVATSTAALAQTTTGTIAGIVTDDTGAVLPGVTVTVRGETIVGTQSTVSNDKGFYRFAALPPGVYDLSFSLSGFANLHRKAVKVSVRGNTEENAAMKVSQMSEEVTVTGESPVVETTGNAVSTTYDKDWVRNAPLRRFTFFDLINAAPGVSQATSTSSRSTSLGSNTTDNAYLLDGTDFTAPLTGAAWPWPNTDAVEEIEVLSLGAPAEYGNLQGAVFNVVTRQGANAFHGDANFYFQHQDLTGRNTTEEQDAGLPYNRDNFKDATVQLSGPVVRDKLWFFGSYQYQRDSDSQPGTDPAFPAASAADRVFFKLNWQVSAKNKLMFAYHDDFYEIPSRGTPDADPSSISIETGHNPSPNVTFTSVLSDKTYVELRYSGFYGKDHGDPLNAGCSSYPCPQNLRVQPRFYDLDTGRTSGGIYIWYDGDSWKTAFAGKLSHFADNFLGGSHDFKFGVQYNSGGSDYVLGYNDYVYTYTYNGTRYGYGYTQAPYHYGGEMRNIGVFLDDTFRINDRLTLNLGLRYDNSRAFFPAYSLLDSSGAETGQSSRAIDNLYTWNTLSPRIGFNYKLTSDGRTVLRAHYGRYYRGIVTGEFASAGPAVAAEYFGLWDFTTNAFDPASLALNFDNTNLRVDEDFKAPYTDQFSASLERELAPNFGVSLHYTHKRGHNYGGWRDTVGQYETASYLDDVGADATGQPIEVLRLTSDAAERQFLLTNPEQMFTRYDGVILQLNKRMSKNWQMVSSLTLGKSEGRIGSSSPRQTPISGQFGTASTFGRNPNDFVNTDGRLLGDRPWQFKTQLVYQAPWGLLLGANLTFQSGLPWGRTIRVTDVTDFTTTVRADSIDGTRRVADWKLVDLRLQKDFSLGRGAHLALFADFLNTLNDDAYENVESSLGTADNFGRPSRFVFPRRMMLGARFRF
jgi:outer membrane receptor protein involved in Fe transport